MFRMNRLLTLLLLVALLLSACQPIQAPAAEPPLRQAEVLIQGPTLRAPETLAMYADGTLAATDYYGRAIVRINPETGEILERLGPAQGVDIPAIS